MGERLQAIFLERTRDEWLEALREVPACVGPVNEVAEALRDPQVRHRGMVAHVEGIPVGPGPAPKLTGFDPGPLRPAPKLGEHTADVLASIGMDQGEIEALRARGVV
jgi:alpha-methylacyl-CoA racemase